MSTFPSLPPKAELLASLADATGNVDHMTNGYLQPLAETLGGRDDVSPREICDAIIEARDRYVSDLGEAGAIVGRQVDLWEDSIVDVLTNGETRPGVKTGLMLNAFDRSSPETQRSVLDSLSQRSDRPSGDGNNLI